MRPLSRGYVLVRSPDPREQPAINPRYLAEDTDRRAMVGGLKFLRRLFAAPALAKYVVAEKMPGPSVQTDDELLDYARQNGSTVYHASCSCMMGNHAMSVVDSELRVHGLDGLRVIDASVMPAVSSTNTNAPTIMIAEKGAAMIRAVGAAEAGGVGSAAAALLAEHFAVDDILAVGLAVEHAEEVLHGGDRHAVDRFAGDPGDMRGGDEILQGQERVVLRRRLLDKDIECGAGDPVRL